MQEPALLPGSTVVTQVEKLPLPKSSSSPPNGIVVESPFQGSTVHGPTVDGLDVSFDNAPKQAPPFRFYGSAEYLHWCTNGARTPALVTTTTNPNPQPQQPLQPPNDFGVLGAPTTVVLFGNEDLNDDARNGARFRLGYWLDRDKPIAVEGSYFFLSRQSEDFFAVTDGSTVISRPFFNGNQGFEDAELVGGAGVGPGMINVEAPSSFWGADLNLRCRLRCGNTCNGGFKVDLFGGARFLRLREGLYITEQGVTVADNTAFRIDDRFDTQNSFYGGQLGIVSEVRRGKWSAEARTSVALGVSHQVSSISGSAIFAPPGGPVRVAQGGLLALPSNIGSISQNKFAVVPEFGLTLGYQVTDSLRATVGYNFLLWSSVLRPGDQIDRTLDITQIPEFTTPVGDGTFIAPNGAIIRPLNPARPFQPLKDSSFWAQGVTLGLEFKY